MERFISEGMDEYLGKTPVPWHMPGHKRKQSNIDSLSNIDVALNMAMAVDVTEVPGTDDLYNPKDMIKNSLDSLAQVYKTYASYYLVNGSTGGILTAITACFRGNNENNGKNKILVARNCHKSVYNAIELLGLEPVYIYPKKLCARGDSPHVHGIEGSVNPKEVERLCAANPGIGAMVLTSPTYEGVLSDIKSIAEILHRYGIKLIVDEAHGAHLPFMSELPASAISCGADLVVQSLHKTMDSLTQTAVLHVIDSSIDEDIRKYLSVYMTSSPSYIFMYSMERAISLAEGRDNSEYLRSIREFRDRVSKLSNVRLVEKKDVCANGGFDYDETRLVITTVYNKASLNGSKESATSGTYLTGTWIGYKLDKIGKIVVEMTGIDYAVLISTPADSAEDFEHLYRVLEILDGEIDAMCGNGESGIKSNSPADFAVENRQGISSENNISSEQIKALIGTKAIDNVYVYPPGSYILTRGEVITEAIAERLIEYVEQGKEIRGKLR